MLSSGIINVAIGLAFIFGVTAALSSVFTELIARLLGLRGAYLLRGLRELLDSDEMTTDLTKVEGDYKAWQGIMTGGSAGEAAAGGKGAPAGKAPAGKTPAAEVPATEAPAGRTPAGETPAAEAPAGRTPAGETPAAEPSAGDTPAKDLAKVPSATGALLGSPIMRSQGLTGDISSRALTLPAAKPGRPAPLPKGPLKFRRSLPAYISATSFADALIDMMVPNAAGETTMDAISRSLTSLQQELPATSPLVESLQTLVANANGNISRFRTSVENWYDNHMDRVSGWYKRRVAKITLAVGAILVLLLNLNTVTIGRTLYSSSVIGAAVSTVAARTTSCQNQSPQACLAGLQAQLSAATQAGLPVGWATAAACAVPKSACNWLDQRGIFSPHGGSPWQAVLVLIGFLITVIALTPGARFWFDLLGKLGSLRSTGPKPASPAG